MRKVKINCSLTSHNTKNVEIGFFGKSKTVQISPVALPTKRHKNQLDMLLWMIKEVQDDVKKNRRKVGSLEK